MEILLSGLNERLVRDLAGAALDQDHVRWQAPDDLLRAPSEGAIGAGQCVFWFYQAPWLVEFEDGQDGAREALAQWLRYNRTALNMRRALGKRLKLVNAGNVSRSQLCNELAPTLRAPEGVAADDEQAPALQGLLARAFEWGGPQYIEVFEALEAASSLQDGVPAFEGRTDIDETELVSLLAALHGNSTLALLRDQLALQQSHHDQLLHEQLSLQQAHHDELLRDQLSMQQRHYEQLLENQLGDSTHKERDELKNECELLLVQLHQVQEELEAYYRKNAELQKSLEARESDGPVSGQPTQMDPVEQVPPAPLAMVAAPVVEQGRSRIVPGLGIARRLLQRVRARKARKGQLATVGASGWFNRDWYLETYPDVRAAKLDPLEHYLDFGWKENRNPGPSFDTEYYRLANPDVENSGINPLLHYIEHGHREGRRPRRA